LVAGRTGMTSWRRPAGRSVRGLRSCRRFPRRFFWLRSLPS
jgi:hypothetical protein